MKRDLGCRDRVSRSSLFYVHDACRAEKIHPNSHTAQHLLRILTSMFMSQKHPGFWHWCDDGGLHSTVTEVWWLTVPSWNCPENQNGGDLGLLLSQQRSFLILVCLASWCCKASVVVLYEIVEEASYVVVTVFPGLMYICLSDFLCLRMFSDGITNTSLSTILWRRVRRIWSHCCWGCGRAFLGKRFLTLAGSDEW